MRKLLLAILSICFFSFLNAQTTQVIQLSASETKLELKNVDPLQFNAEMRIKEFAFENVSDENGDFSFVHIDGLHRKDRVGKADLPVRTSLIEVPYGAEIQITINSYDEEVINLDDYGIYRIMPTQPSYRKNTPVDEMYFVIDEDYYNTDEYESDELVSAEIIGIMRGVRMGRIEIRPYHYNPVENTLIVYNNIDFDVDFVHADLGLTEQMKNKYYSSGFSSAYSKFLNYQEPVAAKDGFSNFNAPLKYVIIANTAFETTLEPFVEWKTKMGYNVIEYYVATGTTNTTIKSYLQDLYDAGTTEDPAPLYVLIIGDHSGTYSIPAFSSQNSGSGGTNQITDLYFATLDGSDYIPDLYYGRISANSTTELQNALDKILPYEQYTIADGSYLNNCMMVAGVDASYAHGFGDAQILYGISNYYNEAHGYSNIWAYFYNNASHEYNVMGSSSSGASASVLSKFQAGVGFANYTAHCSADGWADPSISSSDIASFNNAGEYPFMIGNCCQSFMFNESDAFGEILLYTANEGAMGYIGTSQSSYWYEDAYWGMGLTSLTLNTAATYWDDHTYANTGLGAYDGVWHENGEAWADWHYTGRQMAHNGNLAVTEAGTGYVQYYWEIYHLVGDPSVAPYNTEPSALSLSFTDPMVGDASLTVTTEQYTYVALSKDNVLLDAQWSGSGTSVTLTPPSVFTNDTYCVVGTKQDRSPYVNESIIPTAANPPVAAFSGTPTTILEGEQVTFTDASQYASTWDWDFGDTQTSTEQNPVHTYTTAGTYTVSLTVTNPLPGTDTETKIDYITVNVNTNPPTADFEASATAITVGGSVDFTDLSTNNPTSWEWTFEGASTPTSTDQNPTGIVYPTVGTYPVTLVATNAYGYDDEVKTGYIVVSPPEYCDAWGETTNQLHITNVTLNTIDNDSGEAQYTDFTSISTDLLLGETYDFGVTPAASFSYNECIIWIDYNKDGDFEDTDEEVYHSATGSSAQYDGTITVPGSVSTGETRLRVRQNYNRDGYDPNSTPCGASGYGEVEDYTVNIISPTIPPTADFSSDVTSTCTGAVQFTDESLLAETWEWDFGDGTDSDEQNPLHYYTSNGTYTVALTVYNAYGDDTYTVTDMITVNMPEAPITTGDESCGEASLTLTASGSGTLAWYDAPTEGTLVQTGTSLTDNFSATTTYYVQSGMSPEFFSGGNTDIDVNGGNHTSNNYYLIFSATEDFRLVSVQVNSETEGNRIIQLRNSSSTEIDSKTVYLYEGINTVTLDFDISAGTDYQLKCGTTESNLWRNNTGTSWPYDIGGIVSITGTNAGDENYYYYFYNWEIMVGDECVSARTPVTATIYDLPTVDLGEAQEQCGGTVNLDAGEGFSSYEWNGTPGSQTYEVTSTGNYEVVVEDNNGCTASDNVDITINTVPTAVVVSGGTTQCGGIVDLNATGGSGGTIYWQGTTSGGTSTVTPTTAQSVTESGTYYFRAQSAEGCWGEEGFAEVVINDVPTAVIVSGGGTQCGGSMTLTTTGGEGGTIYWQNTTSGGTSTANPATQETVSVSGTYYFRAQSAEGCWGEEGSATVTIYPAFTAEATATDESAPDANDGSVTVEMTGGTAPFEGTWTPSGTTNTSGTSMTLSDLAGGNYSVIVEDANGCTAEAEATVNTIGAPPVADFEADVTSGCDELVVNFTDLSTNSPIAWAWDFGDGGTSDAQNPQHTYTEPGTYTVSLTVENATDSDTETIEDYIVIGESPTLEMSMTQVTALGNDGTATVTATGGATPYYYQWSNLGSTSTIEGLTAGEYCVTVTETGNSCQASDCITVTEEEPLTPPVANFSADQTMGCESLTVQFTDLSTNEPTSWTWDFGDGSGSSQQNPEHTYTSTGLFTVSLIVENADGSDDMEVSGMIYIGTPPEISVDVVAATGEFNADGSATLNITGGTAPFTITWSNDEHGNTVDNLLPGNYSVMVIDAAGCVVTEPFVVTWISGIADSKTVLSVYPNPARNEINVSTRGTIADNIDIVNVLGQTIITENPDDDVTSIDISHLDKGIYMVRVLTGGKEYVTKLVIQ